jgi:hypothetical protein
MKLHQQVRIQCLVIYIILFYFILFLKVKYLLCQVVEAKKLESSL